MWHCPMAFTLNHPWQAVTRLPAKVRSKQNWIIMSEIQEFCCMISNNKNSHSKTTCQQLFWPSIVLTVYSVLLWISIMSPCIECNLICFDNQHLQTVAGDLGNVKFDVFWQSAIGKSYRRHESSVTCPTPAGNKARGSDTPTALPPLVFGTGHSNNNLCEPYVGKC